MVKSWISVADRDPGKTRIRFLQSNEYQCDKPQKLSPEHQNFTLMKQRFCSVCDMCTGMSPLLRKIFLLFFIIR